MEQKQSFEDWAVEHWPEDVPHECATPLEGLDCLEQLKPEKCKSCGTIARLEVEYRRLGTGGTAFRDRFGKPVRFIAQARVYDGQRPGEAFITSLVRCFYPTDYRRHEQARKASSPLVEA